MNFLEALMEFKKGKKVARTFWLGRTGFGKSLILNKFDDIKNLTNEDIEATNWEIYKGKKTLSDRIIDDGISVLLLPYDVKQALKEFIDWFQTREKQFVSMREFEEKAKEIFGDRLI